MQAVTQMAVMPFIAKRRRKKQDDTTKKYSNTKTKHERTARTTRKTGNPRENERRQLCTLTDFWTLLSIFGKSQH